MASATARTSAPAAEQTSAIALMKEIFVARKAFADAFTSSAVAVSVTMKGVPSARIGEYISRATDSAVPPGVRPSTRRSGCRVSTIACPSLRNSGFQAISTRTSFAESSERAREHLRGADGDGRFAEDNGISGQ